MAARLCLIAARGGSKRLPGKNLMLLDGKPLICHSINQAKASGVCDFIAVSSDDQEILDAAQGADLLIKRPAELASDSASSLDVILHALHKVEEDFSSIILLQPTSPLRLPEDIRKAMEIFAEKPVPSLVSVVKNKNLEPHSPKLGQDRYEINGSIYIWDKKKFIGEPKIIYTDTRLMEMPRLRSLDIDYHSDFELAQILLKNGEYRNGDSQAVTLAV